MRIKRLSFVLAVMILATSFWGCRDKTWYQRKQHRHEFFSGKHELRKMVEYTSTKGEFGAGYFMFFGAASGSQETEAKVGFAWKTVGDTYIISNMLLTRIRVKLEDVNQPTIEFKMNAGQNNDCTVYWNTEIPQETLDSDWLVPYATITCRPEDWNIKIQLPMQKD